MVNDFITLFTNARKQCLLQAKAELLNLLRQQYYRKVSLKMPKI